MFCGVLQQCYSAFVASPHAGCEQKICTTQCSVYSSCEACSAQDRCRWCSLDSTCYPSSVIASECKVSSPTWWGSQNTTQINSPTECGALDTPPGFTAFWYRKPVNKDYPDYVNVKPQMRWDDGVPYHSMDVYWRANIYPFVDDNKDGLSKLLVHSTALGADIRMSVANGSIILVGLVGLGWLWMFFYTERKIVIENSCNWSLFSLSKVQLSFILAHLRFELERFCRLLSFAKIFI